MIGPESISPKCPRCGYDLSGHTASWESSCSVEGSCSECGLEFWWSDVFLPLWVGPRWSFEHYRPRPIGARRARNGPAIHLALTMLLTLHPWRMWREMMVIHKFNWRRLGLLALAYYALLHVPSAVLVLASDDPYSSLGDSDWAILFPYSELVAFDCGNAGQMYLPLWVPLVFSGVSLAMPLSMLILHTSFARVKVRQAHLVRGAVMSLPLVHATVIAFLTMSALDGCAPLLGSGAVQAMQTWAPSAMLLAVLVGYGIWWRTFLKKYVQMPQPTLTTIVLMILSGLFVLTAAFVISLWSN